MIFSPVSRGGQLSGFAKRDSYILLNWEAIFYWHFKITLCTPSFWEESNPIILKELFQLHYLKIYFPKGIKLSGPYVFRTSAVFVENFTSVNMTRFWTWALN